MTISTVYFGPSGGDGSNTAASVQIPEDAVVTGIGAVYDSYVESITLFYDSSSEGSGSVTYGGTGGGTSVTQMLKPGEVITSLQGTFGTLINTLCVWTNLATYGPWGSAASPPLGYRYDIPATCRLVGVFGFVGSHIDACGFIMQSPSVA